MICLRKTPRPGGNRACDQSSGSRPLSCQKAQQVIVKRIRRAKLFVFLREHRHQVFDAAFQEELATLYQDSPRGQPPVAPALLALATILQAYTGASDDEVRDRESDGSKLPISLRLPGQ